MCCPRGHAVHNDVVIVISIILLLLILKQYCEYTQNCQYATDKF